MRSYQASQKRRRLSAVEGLASSSPLLPLALAFLYKLERAQADSPKSFLMMVARDGVEPPTPAFSVNNFNHLTGHGVAAKYLIVRVSRNHCGSHCGFPCESQLRVENIQFLTRFCWINCQNEDYAANGLEPARASAVTADGSKVSIEKQRRGSPALARKAIGSQRRCQRLS